jgi:hypothetical protein
MIGAFHEAISLTTIEIPNSVTSISTNAFYGTTNLTTVTFEADSQLISIGGSVFGYAISLTTIVIPNSVTSIGSYCFTHATALTSIIIPSSVGAIGSFAFNYDSSLTIYVEALIKPAGWDDNWNYTDQPVVWGWEFIG